MEDVRDYSKIASASALGSGKHCFRILVNNIKNNGLMLGVCTENAKQNMDNIPFNDLNLISINSCGYLINRGRMSTFSGKIKSGDTLRMLINRSLGEVRWYCNDMELAAAEMGPLKQNLLYPFLGLGNFLDEVELLHSKENLSE